MPKIRRPVASSFIASVAMSCGAKPPVRTVINPSATALMARVKIIDGTRRYATPMPLMSPNARPHRMPTGMAKVAPHGPHPAAAVDIIPPTVMIHGTERSICPSRITIIMPVETSARKEPTWSCCSRYSGDRKFSLTMLPISSSTTMQPNAVRTAGSNRRRTGLAGAEIGHGLTRTDRAGCGCGSGGTSRGRPRPAGQRRGTAAATAHRDRTRTAGRRWCGR